MDAVPPFPHDVHVKTLEPSTVEQRSALKALRSQLELSKNEYYYYAKTWCDDEQLIRFLVARNYNVEKAFTLTLAASEWRFKRKPSEIEQQAGWEAMISKEAETGKIYFAGFDRYQRPVVILDNSVQNTRGHDGHIVFLAWNLELGCRSMNSSVDKYVILINLQQFSLMNNPTLQTTKGTPSLTVLQPCHYLTLSSHHHLAVLRPPQETIKMLCDCFPERLGHLICYQPPWVFKGVFDAVKMFIDPKTVSKVHFLVGDDSEGTENDAKMRAIIGDNWRELTGAGQPVISPGCSPGFDFSVYWPSVMKRVQALQVKESAAALANRSGNNTGSGSGRGSDSGSGNNAMNLIRAYGDDDVLAVQPTLNNPQIDDVMRGGRSGEEVRMNRKHLDSSGDDGDAAFNQGGQGSRWERVDDATTPSFLSRFLFLLLMMFVLFVHTCDALL